MPPRNSATSQRGVKRAADQISSAVPASLSEDNSYKFKPENLSDITVHYQSKSYRVHQYVLVTKLKYFDALMTSKPDGACVLPDCLLNDASHRCIKLEGTQLGGVNVSTDDLLTFFHHMYAAADSNGDWDKVIDAKRKPASPSCWPRDFYFGIIHDVDPTTDTTSVDFYLFDGIRRYDMKGATCGTGLTQTKASSYKIGACFDSSAVNNHPNLHLADYFQADSMMKQYETQAGLVVKTLPGRSSIIIWKIAQIADRYGWQEVRATCIPLCSKVNKLTAPWRDFARKLKPDTLIEIFEASKLAS